MGGKITFRNCHHSLLDIIWYPGNLNTVSQLSKLRAIIGIIGSSLGDNLVH